MQLCQSRNSLFCLIVIMLYNTPLRYVSLFLTLCVALNFSSLVRPTTLNFNKGNTFFFIFQLPRQLQSMIGAGKTFLRSLKLFLRMWYGSFNLLSIVIDFSDSMISFAVRLY